jgi:hypothetical protein
VLVGPLASGSRIYSLALSCVAFHVNTYPLAPVAMQGRKTCLPSCRMDSILILSAKGDVGKTTVARELAVAGRRVALIDLDPQLGLWYGPQGAGDAPVGRHAIRAKTWRSSKRLGSRS